MDKFSFNVTLRYIVLIAGLLLTTAVATLYAWFNQWNLSLDSALKIFGLGVGVTTAIYAAINLRHIYESHIESIEHQKKVYSARLMERWLDPEMTKTILSAKSLLSEIDKSPNAEQAYKLFNEKNAERHSLISVLNFFEQVSITIDNGLSNEVMVKEFFRGLVVSHYNTMKVIIDLRRQKSNNQRIYISFETLARRWS